MKLMLCVLFSGWFTGATVLYGFKHDVEACAFFAGLTMAVALIAIITAIDERK